MRFFFSGCFCDEKRFDDVVEDGRSEAMGWADWLVWEGGGEGRGSDGVGRREELVQVVIIVSKSNQLN